MKQIFNIAIVCLASWLTPVNIFGQAKPEFETSYNENFLRRASLLNEAAPNVEVYDENGNGFRLEQSRGKHTVVVFGCLT